MSSMALLAENTLYRLSNCKKFIEFHVSPNIKRKNILSNLNRNKIFKDLHKGERCFIVGNGPSLKVQDLSVLSDQYVFTVNQIARNLQYPNLNANYHFWADPTFFNLNPDNEGDMEVLKQFKAINTATNQPVCFMPFYANEFVNRFNLQNELHIYYYHSIYSFYDKCNSKIDFTKPTFGYQTVVQFAISMAIFMGFSEIYLLGCDTTGIIGTIEALLGDQVNQYAYQVTDNEKKRMADLFYEKKIEDDFYGWGRILHLYNELYRYCSKRNIKLYNCSAKTIIDSIPKIEFQSLFQ